MITDAILDAFISVLEWVGDQWEGIAPTFDFSGFEAGFENLTIVFSYMANFVHFPVLAAALGFVLTWEVAFVGGKLLLKLWRLLPFT